MHFSRSLSSPAKSRHSYQVHCGLSMAESSKLNLIHPTHCSYTLLMEEGLEKGVKIESFAVYFALHCITLHCITFHYIVLHCITLHCISLDYFSLLCIARHCNKLHCITLHYIVLHCITLHCITLHYFALHYISRKLTTTVTITPLLGSKINAFALFLHYTSSGSMNAEER